MKSLFIACQCHDLFDLRNSCGGSGTQPLQTSPEDMPIVALLPASEFLHQHVLRIPADSDNELTQVK